MALSTLIVQSDGAVQLTCVIASADKIPRHNTIGVDVIRQCLFAILSNVFSSTPAQNERFLFH